MECVAGETGIAPKREVQRDSFAAVSAGFSVCDMLGTSHPGMHIHRT